jgi:Flp pilus assembly protein TadD
MDTPGRIAELERKFAENPRRYFAALANEFRKQGEFDRAIELCEAHLAEQRNHLSGHVVLAQALVDAGRESDAWDPLHTALDLDPENFIALRLIGELFARVGDVDHARTYFFRALEIEPRNEDLLASVKNLSQRSVTDEPIGAEQSETAGAPVAAPETAGDIAPLQGLDSTIAFDAEAAAEPVADEVGTADGEPEAESGGRPETAGPVDAQPEATGQPQPEPPARAWPEADGEQLAEKAEPQETAWAEVPAEPPPAEAGAADRYDHHDWLPPLPTATEEREADVTGVGAEQEAEPAEPSEAATAAEAVEGAEPSGRYGPGESPARPEPLQPVPEDPRPALASETMADLYLQQGHTSLAIDVLRELAETRPDDERLRSRLAELEVQAAAAPRETVRDMFARFARSSRRLRERGHQGSAPSGVSGDEPRDAGPLADFFAGAPGSARGRRTPPDALLAMLAPQDAAPADEGGLGQWLGTLRGS